MSVNISKTKSPKKCCAPAGLYITAYVHTVSFGMNTCSHSSHGGNNSNCEFSFWLVVLNPPCMPLPAVLGSALCCCCWRHCSQALLLCTVSEFTLQWSVSEKKSSSVFAVIAYYWLSFNQIFLVCYYCYVKTKELQNQNLWPFMEQTKNLSHFPKSIAILWNSTSQQEFAGRWSQTLEHGPKWFWHQLECGISFFVTKGIFIHI